MQCWPRRAFLTNSEKWQLCGYFSENVLHFRKKALSLQRLRKAASKKRHAPVAKLVDAPDLGSGVLRRVGSSPIRRTIGQKRIIRENFPLFYFCNLLIIEQLGVSRNLLWIIILLTAFPVLFYGYSLIVIFSLPYFFRKSSKKPCTKEFVATPLCS